MAQSSKDWVLQGKLPQDFHVLATCLYPGQLAIFGGYESPPSSPIEDRRASILRYSDGQSLRTLEEPGWVVDIAVLGDLAWAIVAQRLPGQDLPGYRLFHSRNQARTWAEVGSIPAASLAQLTALTEKELWLLGAQTLLRSPDGGQSWQGIQAPGERNPSRERLYSMENIVLLLGEGVYASVDSGKQWVHHATEDFLVGAVGGGLLLGYSKTEARLGQLGPEGGVDWVAIFERAMRPFALHAWQTQAFFLAVPRDERIGQGLYFYSTLDQGKSWSGELLHVRPDSHSAALAEDGSGIAVDPENRVLVRFA